jgi:hypothetical protein
MIVKYKKQCSSCDVDEIDEKHHNRQIQKDEIRQKEIQDLLNCKFIRIPFVEEV